MLKNAFASRITVSTGKRRRTMAWATTITADLSGQSHMTWSQAFWGAIQSAIHRSAWICAKRLAQQTQAQTHKHKRAHTHTHTHVGIQVPRCSAVENVGIQAPRGSAVEALHRQMITTAVRVVEMLTQQMCHLDRWPKRRRVDNACQLQGRKVSALRTEDEAESGPSV